MKRGVFVSCMLLAACGDDAKEAQQPGFSYEVVAVDYAVCETEPGKSQELRPGRQ